LQQAGDPATFEQVQRGPIDAALLDHEGNLETKKRLSCIISEFDTRRAIILEKRSAQYERKQAAAQVKIEEKAKRRATMFNAREDERLRRENRFSAKQRRRSRERKKVSRSVIYEPSSFFSPSKNASVKRKKPLACGRSVNDSARRTLSASR
jgi:translation initiation factor 3 subunit A